MKKLIFILIAVLFLINLGCASIYKFMGIATAADMKTVNETLDVTLTDQQKKNASLVQELKAEIEKLKKEIQDLQKTALQMEKTIALAQNAKDVADESAKKVLAFEKRLMEVQKRIDQAANESLKLLDSLLNEYLKNLSTPQESSEKAPVQVNPIIIAPIPE